MGAFTVYEEIGRELVGLIEHRDSQKVGTSKVEEAQAMIEGFLKRISARRGKGRPRRAVSQEMLESLYQQGSDIIEVVWAVLPTHQSSATREFLADHGITDPTVQNLWATHLALPVLSVRELAAVHRYQGSSKWLTPRRLAVLFLARRLGVDAAHVARRMVGSDEEEEFKIHGDYPI